MPGSVSRVMVHHCHGKGGGTVAATYSVVDGRKAQVSEGVTEDRRQAYGRVKTDVISVFHEILRVKQNSATQA